VRAIIAPASDFVLNVPDGTTDESDAWVAGVAQVETATAVGTIGSGNGNAEIIVTCDSMDNSPKTILVDVTSGDTAAVWAGKVRTALAADVDVASVFSVGGASTAIVLTVKEIGGLSIPIYQDNDSTINIAIDNGTCTGITPAATSANTTQGVATSGCVIYDGDGKDFEGIAIPTITNLKGMILEGVSGVVAYATESYGTMGLIDPAEIPTLTANSLLFDELTFSSSGPSEIRITVIGETA
jgi:phage tail sheath gpL-like